MLEKWYKLLMGSLFAACIVVGPAQAQEQKPIHLGLAKTFLVEQPKGVAEIATDDFKVAIQKATGLEGDLVSKFSAFEVAEKVDGKQLDFGIFHAHEFAWVQKKYPQLSPLLIAADKFRVERAYVIVHKSSPAKSIGDLRGKKLDLPIGTKEHCRLYLDQYCVGKDVKSLASFFGELQKSGSKKESLDNVALKKVDAAVIDRNGLEFYKEIRLPVFEKNLRVLAESEDFPPAVIVYKPGTLDKKIVDQFRDGMLKAHTIADGRDMMKSWNLDRFESVPKDYAKSLSDILKAYPPR
jgi:ABC-type phosphate/phosphonate transport system substrate-binding protein